METNELIQQLAAAIHHWLSYVSLCTNSNLLAESSVRYPFVEFLERKCKTAVRLEEQHNDFPARHIDFCFENRNDFLAIELKYASKHTRGKAEKQRVFNDLVRLALMVNNKKSTRGFFIMCGETKTFIANFMNIVDGETMGKQLRQDGGNMDRGLVQHGDYYELFFGFARDEERIINLTENSYVEYHKSFIKDYYAGKNNVELGFSVIKTRRISYLPAPKQTSQSQTVAIWEVLVIK